MGTLAVLHPHRARLCLSTTASSTEPSKPPSADFSTVWASDSVSLPVKAGICFQTTLDWIWIWSIVDAASGAPNSRKKNWYIVSSPAAKCINQSGPAVLPQTERSETLKEKQGHGFYQPRRKVAAAQKSASLCCCPSAPCDQRGRSGRRNWFSPFSGLCFQDPRNNNFLKLLWRTMIQPKSNWKGRKNGPRVRSQTS